MFGRAIAIAESISDDLMDLVKIAGGDPATFFVGADFSDVDISGVDFTGCSLSGVRFENTLIDDKTILPVSALEAIRDVSFIEYNDDYFYAQRNIQNAELQYLQSIVYPKKHTGADYLYISQRLALIEAMLGGLHGRWSNKFFVFPVWLSSKILPLNSDAERIDPMIIKSMMRTFSAVVEIVESIIGTIRKSPEGLPVTQRLAKHADDLQRSLSESLHSKERYYRIIHKKYEPSNTVPNFDLFSIHKHRDQPQVFGFSGRSASNIVSQKAE